MSKPWTIEENPSGFVYVVDHDGKKICTVYGNADLRMQRAMAIAKIPVLVSILKKRKDKNEGWEILDVKHPHE